jgi:RNA polymerase sigma-70 factor, ECF subfamily
VQRSPDDLSTLMRAANRGDAVAYHQVLSRLAAVLRPIARLGLARTGRESTDAEDIVQETLLAIHLKRHTWDEAQPLMPWVRAIAHHKLVDSFRRRGFRAHLPIEDFEGVLADAAAPSPTSSIECEAILARLSQRQRQIVEAISIEGHSARDVGARLSMTEGAVRVTLHRALKKLADGFRREDT